VTGRREHRGFTLLEVVLAISLAVVVMGSAIAFYRTAVNVRAGLAEEADALSRIHLAMDLISRELASAAPAGALGVGLSGDNRQFSLVTAGLPGPVAWAVPSATETPPPPEQDLRRVTYQLQTAKSDRGQAVVTGLQRNVQKLLNATQAVVGEEVATSRLTDRVRFLYVRYWTGRDYVDQWNQSTLPPAVEVTLGAEPLEEGLAPADYPHEIFRRLIYLSVGTADRTGGTVIHDGPGGPS
jgi:prepilin-type N-terminal cleavage/methylation domain-containing protein